MKNNYKLVDLHTHTNKSDGDLSPNELMRLAKSKGIELISITDHDTTSALEEGEVAANNIGIDFIPGIEISTKEGKELHILGYNIDKTNPVLIEACDEFMRLRLEREKRILEFLNSKGLEIDEEDVRQEVLGEYIGRPHIAQAMVRKGYVNSIREAFLNYLATDEFQKIERPKPTASEGISVIEAAGGVAVLAHPHSLHLDAEGLKKMVKYLKVQGLKGVECYYSAYNQEESERYRQIAIDLDLIVTGGSDFHGPKSKPNVELGIDGKYTSKIEYDKLLNPLT